MNLEDGFRVLALDFVFSDTSKNLNLNNHSSSSQKNIIQATHDVLDFEMERNEKTDRFTGRITCR